MITPTITAPLSRTSTDSLFQSAQRIEQTILDLHSAFAAIQQPRSSFQIEHFVVGQHESPERQYMQCVLELQYKYINLRRALLDRELLLLDIDKLMASSSPRAPLNIQKKRLAIEELDLALLGTIREFHVLHSIYQTFPAYSYEDLQSAEASYWQARLTRQAQQDITSTGRIGVGNLDALRQLTTPVGPPQLSSPDSVVTAGPHPSPPTF